jgi:putative oxygen-independent coproporphyrinogen III oxidase
LSLNLSESTSTLPFQMLDSEQNLPTSAYVHIPFCRRRCFYCDFPVSVLGDRRRGENSGTVAQYVDVLAQEIRHTPTWGQPLQTVFLGGGTPSLLSVPQLEHILATLDRQFGIAKDAEISMEMDPGTFDYEHLQGYKQLGVNRVSYGVQSFQSQLLQQMGRTHGVEDIYTAVDLLHQAGICNFSLDLISGLPNQTLAQWQQSLEAAIAIAPTHLSVYDLIVEPGTAFSRSYRPGETPLPSDEMAAQMYRWAQQRLTGAGYEHYEISNYAQVGYACRHNRVYWERQPFYGFGMGAASYINQHRFTRPRTLKQYSQWVQAAASSPLAASIPALSDEITSPTSCLLETLMLGLRLADGLDLSVLRAQFGDRLLRQVWACLHPYYEKGWMAVIDPKRDVRSIKMASDCPQQGRIRLTDPEGFLFSNSVLSTLFSQLDDA